MKKFYLSLLGVMMALTVGAQQSYTTYMVDPVTNEKTEQWDYTYENGKIMEEHVIYYHADGNVELKTLYIYNDQGRLLRMEDYEMRDGEYVMTDLREDTEFNEDGFIATITFYTEDEKNPGQLIPDIKYFVYRYQGISAIDIRHVLS